MNVTRLYATYTENVYRLYGPRIRRGIAALDAYDLDWRDYVDPDRLDVGSPEWCVVGQVFRWLGPWNGFVDATRLLGAPTYRDDLDDGQNDELFQRWSVDHGFDVDSSGDESYHDLTTAWRHALTIEQNRE